MVETAVTGSGSLHSGVGTCNITVLSANELEVTSNLVTELTVDGDLSDWVGFRSFGADADDVNGTENPIDYPEGWAADDEESFYLPIKMMVGMSRHCTVDFRRDHRQ